MQKYTAIFRVALRMGQENKFTSDDRNKKENEAFDYISNWLITGRQLLLFIQES